MKKIFTHLLMLFAALLIIGSDLANAQTLTDTWTATPAWNASSTYRGFAYGNNRLYVGGRSGWPSAGTVQVMNAMTGNDIKTLDNTGIPDLTFDLADAEFSDDGSILAAPLTLNASSESGWGVGYFTIYRWENEDSEPVPFIVYQGSGRVDMFTVVGDVTGDAVVMGAISSTSTVWRYIITGGVVGDLEEITLDGSIPTGSVSVAYPTGLTASDGFWYNNVGTHPTLCDNTGAVVGLVPATVFEGAEGNTGQMKAFSYDSKDYLLVADNGKAKLINITGKQPADLTATDVVYTTQGVFDVNQDVAYRIGADGSLSVFAFSANNGIYSGSTEAAPVATDLNIDGTPLIGDGDLTAQYVYADINGDAEASSEIKWYVDGAEVGTGTTYTLVAGDAGKYVHFTVLPVAATGTVSHVANLATSAQFGPVLTAMNPPVASNVVMTGAVEYDSTLTATYDYSDPEGDDEGESIYKWYYADDAAGSNIVEVASDTLMYKVGVAAIDKFIIFEVTPVAQTGYLTEGTTVKAISVNAVPFPPSPRALNITISGHEVVSYPLSGTYDYFDVYGDDESGTTFQWYRADAVDGTKTAIAGATTTEYTLDAADESKYIFFGVIAKSAANTGPEYFDTTGAIAAFVGVAPVAENVVANGIAEVDVVLGGTYDYSDAHDLEGASTFKWYVADDATGTNEAEISGETGKTYLVTESDLGKYLAFEVTPVALTGGELTGTPVKSDYTAAVVASDNTFGIERLWLASSKKDAVPYYINPSVTTERGFAIGTDHIYIASRYGGTKVVIIDKTDGSYVGELNTDGIEGGVYTINDVEVSDDGQILAAPLTFGSEFWIYKWSDELATPEKWITATLSGDMRLGDKFSVTGDLSSGTAIIMAAKSEGDKLIRWVVTDGIAGAAKEITLSGVTSIGNSPAAVPVTASVDADILVDGKGFAPTVFDKDGILIGSIPRIDDYGTYKIQSNSPNAFQHKGRTLAAFFQAMRQTPLGARIIIADITELPYQVVDSSEYVSNSMAWDGYLGEVDVTTDNDYYYAYMLQAKNAVAAYRGELTAPEFISAITTHDGDTVMVDFDLTIKDIETTDASVWTINAGGTALTVDSIFNVGNTIYFDLADAAPITEGQAVTVSYDGTGSIAAFTGLPLAAFGPEDVENIVGAEVPVATDVTVTGDPYPTSVLTGTYTFTDPDGDLEGTSLYQWYEATDDAGANELKLLGENSVTYTVDANMTGKYLAFEVTPVSATGGADYLEGLPVKSAYILVNATGIEENLFAGLVVYPNPVISMLTIDNCDDVQTISIMNVTGKLMQTMETNFESRVTINMEAYGKGIYFLKLNADDGSSRVVRIVKVQ
ncbi:MAG: T9SS type A sorting domain-containing protein [Bacteroidota bacterium]|nr:T9SS type A sorting domain-containing protein [Bacteroidota bacterium]